MIEVYVGGVKGVDFWAGDIRILPPAALENAESAEINTRIFATDINQMNTDKTSRKGAGPRRQVVTEMLSA
jgi:hypothetical protein